jgi:hypothetical protein
MNLLVELLYQLGLHMRMYFWRGLEVQLKLSQPMYHLIPIV